MNEPTYDSVDNIDPGISAEAFQDSVLAEYRTQAEAQHRQEELALPMPASAHSMICRTTLLRSSFRVAERR